MSLHQDHSFESCIKCTVCTTYCPVAKVNPLYPGPKQAGPDGERLRLKDPALYDEALKYCTNCKRCEVACPSDVKIGDIIQRARADFAQSKPTLRDAILSHTDIMGSLSTPFAPIVNAATGLKPVRKLLDKALKIDHRRELPKYSFGTFRRWYRQQAQDQQRYAEQVAFFHGCFVNYNHPQLGKDLIRVFNALDIGVQLLKREKCCGVPLIANGFIDQAKSRPWSTPSRCMKRCWSAAFRWWRPHRAAPSPCATNTPICWTWTLPRCAIGWSWRRAISIA